jgi:hypothetical protein
MSSARKAPIALVVTLFAALGVTASPALAGTYTLNLSGPSSAAVGQPLVIQAAGANPADDFFSSWLDVAAIPTSVLSSCPAGYLNASQIASSTSSQGGENVATALREDVDSAGIFSMPLAYTPGTPGRFLICGYTNDGATATLATASMLLDVQGAGATAPAPPSSGKGQPPSSQVVAKPANLKKPRVKRSGGKLVCSRGSWQNATSYSYAWLVNGRRKRSATGRTLRVTDGLQGRRAQCKVTASNAGARTTALSRAVRVR